MGTFKKDLLNQKRGNIAMTMALMAPVFVGVVGLSVETGYWYYLNDVAQNAADLSAYTGTTQMRANVSDADSIQAAKDEAATLGFGASIATVSANTPPTSGPNMNSGSMEVIITYEASRYFSSVFNKDKVIHETRAVATYRTGGNACILALDETAPAALKVRGTTLIDAAGCEMMSNSSASDSVQITGDSETTIDCVSTAGQVDEQGRRFRMNLLECPSYKTEVPRLPDPYESVVEPRASLEPCETVPSATSGTLDPGPDGVMRFCGDLNLKGTWDFEPGVYIIDGGEFISDGGDFLSGDDVTFYFTNGGNARWQGNSEVNFSAPTTGTYGGILLFGDRSDTTPLHRIAGTNTSSLVGAMYAASAGIELTGTFDGLDTCLQLVAGTIDMSGTSNITWDCEDAGATYLKAPDRVLLVE